MGVVAPWRFLASVVAEMHGDQRPIWCPVIDHRRDAPPIVAPSHHPVRLMMMGALIHGPPNTACAMPYRALRWVDKPFLSISFGGECFSAKVPVSYSTDRPSLVPSMACARSARACAVLRSREVRYRRGPCRGRGTRLSQLLSLAWSRSFRLLVWARATSRGPDQSRRRLPLRVTRRSDERSTRGAGRSVPGGAPGTRWPENPSTSIRRRRPWST